MIFSLHYRLTDEGKNGNLISLKIFLAQKMLEKCLQPFTVQRIPNCSIFFISQR